jgi:hypothetical protein
MTTKKPYPIKDKEQKRQCLYAMWNALSKSEKDIVCAKVDRTAGHVSNIVNGMMRPNLDIFNQVFNAILDAYLEQRNTIQKLIILAENDNIVFSDMDKK